MAHEQARGVQVSTTWSYASGVKFVWALHIGHDIIGESMIPDQFAKALAIRFPDPDDNATLPLPPSWLSSLPLPGSEPWEAPAIVMGFCFLWRISNYAEHYDSNNKARTSRLRVAHVTTPPGHIEITLTTDKNVNTNTRHRRFATSTRLCPRALYMAYATTRASHAPTAPAFQRPDGSPVTDDDVSKALKRLACAHGVPHELLHGFTPHTLRKGGIVAARALAFGDTWCLREGRWANIRSMTPYIRTLPEINCVDTMALLLPGVFGQPGATR
jgi:hypothetical protein